MDKTKLRKIVWLAFQASSPMQMGFLHTAAASKVTEENILDVVGERDGKVHTDYVCGRMMKTSFKLTPDGDVVIEPSQPRLDYQSWGAVYRTADELRNAAEKALQHTMTKA